MCALFIILHLQRVYVQKEATEYGIQTNGTHLITTFILLTWAVQTKSFLLQSQLANLMGKSKKSINVGKQLCEHHDEVKCTYFVLLAVKILLRVESMADLKIFAKNNSSNFTLMVAIWVSRTNVTRYSTFLTKAGK